MRAVFLLWITMERVGWIREYRKLLDNPIIKKPLYCHLWNTLLLLAQHEKHSFIWKNNLRTLEPGQLLTGRKQLAEQTGISEGHIETILNYLENQQQIIQQKTNKFRIISIINWALYQSRDGQQTTKQQQPKQQAGQQKDTYKNVKNENNNKYIEEFEKFRKAYPGKKRGESEEYDNFRKKHKDSKDVLSLLSSALEQQIAQRSKDAAAGFFVPPWKNLSTWINGRCWTEQTGVIETPESEEGKKQKERIRIEQEKEETRKDYGKYYQEKSTEELQDLLKDERHNRVYGWLIKETLASRS